METTTMKIGDFFRHKGEKCQAIGGKLTSVAFASVPEEVFSPARGTTAKKEVKASGFGRVLDYLYHENNACVYLDKDNSQAYAEFAIGENTYSALVDSENIRFYESDIPGRWHLLVAVLAQFAQNSGEILERLKKYEIERDVTNALAFCDSFYYARPTDDISITYGDSSVGAEAEAGFRSGLFAIKFGNKTSIMDDIKPLEDAPKGPKAKGPKKKTTSKKTEEEILWEEIKEGKHVLDYEWSDIQKPFIQPLEFLKDFVPDKNFFHIFKQVEKRALMALGRLKDAKEGEKVVASRKDAINVFLAGKPGTGKTYLLFALSASLGVPVRSIPMSKNSEEDIFEGMSKVIDGKLTEVRTPFLINGEEGGISIIEEINLASPDVVMGAIGQFVEFPYSIMEQGYKQVHRHPLNFVFGTMNIGTAGSKEINEALSSRFPETFILDDPTESDFIARLKASGYDVSEKAIDWVYARYTTIIETLKSPDFNCEEFTLNVNFRSCLGALRCIEDGFEPKEAIRTAMIGKIAEKDFEVADRIWDIITSEPDLTL